MATISGGTVGAGSGRRMVCIREQVLKSAFTDGGGTSGTYNLTVQLPAGFFVEFTKVTVDSAWSGDTTAVLIVGDGSDTDRYNTGTPSILTTGLKDMGVPSGQRMHTAAATVTLTVTGTADFTNILGTGQVTIEIYGWETASV